LFIKHALSDKILLDKGGMIEEVVAVQKKDFRDQSVVFAFFSWWLVFVPSKIIYVSKKLLKKTYDFFSIDLLFRTILLPWKRDELDTTNMSLDQKLQVMIMNIVSRFVGAAVRGGTILIGFLIMVAIISAAIIGTIGFFLIPVIIIAMIFFLPFI